MDQALVRASHRGRYTLNAFIEHTGGLAPKWVDVGPPALSRLSGSLMEYAASYGVCHRVVSRQFQGELWFRLVATRVGE